MEEVQLKAKVLKEKVYFKSQMLDFSSIGWYYNIYIVPISPNLGYFF